MQDRFSIPKENQFSCKYHRYFVNVGVNEVILQLYVVINSLTGRRFTILQIEKNNAAHIKRASIQNRTAALNMYLAYNSVTFLIDRCLSC